MSNIRPRTYKELIQLFQDICSDLLSVKFFNYGELEDMEVNDASYMKGLQQNLQYPYVFLNTTSVSIIQGWNSFTINLFVFELCDSDRTSVLEAQDTTLQILHDILSKIKMTRWGSYQDGAVNSIYTSSRTDASFDYPVIATPISDFNKNGAAGWQATFTISLKNPLDLKNAPFV